MCAVILLGIICVIIGGVIDEKKKEKWFRKKLVTNYGKKPTKQYPSGRIDTIRGYSNRIGADFLLDDITWNDLDMDRLFQRMDYTYSAAGEEYLYYMLRSPKQSEESLERLEELVSYFMEHEKERVELQVLFAKIGRTGKYSIFDYMGSLEKLKKRSNAKHYLQVFLLLLSIAVCFVNMEIGVCTSVAMILINIFSYFQEKKEVSIYVSTFAYLLRLLESVRKFKQLNLSIIKEEVSVMEQCARKCANFRRGSFMVTSMNNISSNPLEFVWDYIKMVFHIDLIKFNLMLEEAKKHKEDFVTIFEVTGRLESYISIGAYRKSLSYYALPEFNMEETGMHTELLYHPLIDEPVANSFTEKRGMLLTGSNASGKSTFLKTVAINAILAQSVHTVLAKKYVARMYRIYSSMALRDDLEGGDSYFIVEIKALKRIFDAMKEEGRPVLCFVDEVLRGTNTVERIAASCEILKQLNTTKHICFAATHDIELTELLKESYSNYHFEETIQNDDVLFNYKLLEGKARTRNAIKLLSILGFDKEIISCANSRAEIFMNKGVWN